MENRRELTWEIVCPRLRTEKGEANLSFGIEIARRAWLT